MSGRHYDEDGDGVADQGLVDPYADRQHAVFADADPADLVTDDAVAAMYDSGELRDTTAGTVIPVEEHEAAEWDADRTGAKTPEEAAQALAARVADPSAPDTDAAAYDGL